MSVSLPDLTPLLGMGIVIATALLLLMYEVFSDQLDRRYHARIAAIGLLVAMYFVAKDIAAPTRALFASNVRAAPIVVDAFARASSLVMMAGALIACLLSPAYAKNQGHDFGEYYSLILFAVVGMMVMVMSGDLFTFFVGLETMSIAVYALTGLRARDPRASEAALKYFLMGAFATGFLLFGIALVYGASSTGSVSLSDLARTIAASNDAVMSRPLLGIGLVLILIGFAFKIAAVPFHMWAPDVYEGAPTPVTGFMAVGVKAAAFLGLLRIVIVGLSAQEGGADAIWVDFLSGLAVVTILVGNAIAIVQQSIKRMLAYSSVSHAGYALIGVVAAAQGEAGAGRAVLFYLTTYTFMTLGAFGVLTYLEREDGGVESERFGAFAGIGYKHPALSIAMALFMVALAGMPPTGGFFGKLYVFSSALRAGETTLALVGIFGSVVSVYYYLRVIVAFYMRDVPDAGPTPQATRSTELTIGLVLSTVAVLVLGIAPSTWLDVTDLALKSLANIAY